MKSPTVSWPWARALAFRFSSRCSLRRSRRNPRSPKRGESAKKKKSKARRDDAQLKERLFELRKRGYNRLYQNGQIFEFSTPESLLDLNFAEPVLILSTVSRSRPTHVYESLTR